MHRRRRQAHYAARNNSSEDEPSKLPESLKNPFGKRYRRSTPTPGGTSSAGEEATQSTTMDNPNDGDGAIATVKSALGVIEQKPRAPGVRLITQAEDDAKHEPAKADEVAHPEGEETVPTVTRLFRKQDRSSDKVDDDGVRKKRKLLTPMQQMKAALFNSWINVLLIAVPLRIAQYYHKVSPVAVFVVNFAAIIPLAALLSYVTEEIALRSTEITRGLLNASLGNAAKLTSALVTVVSSLSSAVPMIALGVLAMSQPVDALSPGGDQTRHPNISDKFREMVEEFVVPLVQSLMTAAIVVFFHVVVCRCIQAGATSGVLHQRGMHKARWHSLYALFVSTGSTYLLHNGGEPPEAIFVVALIAICFLSTERFSFYFFRYHGRPSFDHGFIPLVSGSILSAFLHAIDYLGCAPLAFWFSVLLGPLLSRALQSTNMNLLGAGRTAVEQGSAAVRIEGTDARDDNAGGDATATGDNGLFVVGDENGSIDIADIADIAIGYGA